MHHAQQPFLKYYDFYTLVIMQFSLWVLCFCSVCTENDLIYIYILMCLVSCFKPVVHVIIFVQTCEHTPTNTMGSLRFPAVLLVLLYTVSSHMYHHYFVVFNLENSSNCVKL